MIWNCAAPVQLYLLRVVPVLLLAVPFGDELSALQRVPELTAGTRVRVTLMRVGDRPGPMRLTGSLVAVDPSSVLLATGRMSEPARIPRSFIAEVAVSRGPGFCSGSVRALCVLAGLVGGTALGATVGGLLGTQSSDEYAVFGGIVIGGVAGAVGGTIVGAGVGGERWEEVSMNWPQSRDSRAKARSVRRGL